MPCVYLPGPAPAVTVANNMCLRASHVCVDRGSMHVVGHHVIFSPLLEEIDSK